MEKGFLLPSPGSTLTTTGATMRELKKRLAKILIERSYREGDFTSLRAARATTISTAARPRCTPKGRGSSVRCSTSCWPIWTSRHRRHDARRRPLISATTVISHEKGRPLAGLIVRKESKGHGTNQYVEGLSNFRPGDPVAMVEDVVTTGGSLLKACERVKDAGLNVVACVPCLTVAKAAVKPSKPRDTSSARCLPVPNWSSLPKKTSRTH